MIHAPLAVSVFFLLFATLSFLYTDFAVFRVVTLKAVQRSHCKTPSMSVLKPLAGLEPELEENLRSFCEQEYPLYQIVFCAHDDGDPALGVARRIAASMPQRDIVVVSGGGRPLVNPKIENLQAAMPRATGEIVVVADSDMRVDSQYLRQVADAFDDSRVGAVTALYSARASGGIVSELGALFVNDQFAPSVLVATALQPLRFCFGATMAVRRGVLAQIGGLGAIGATIADDYALGDIVAKAGWRVALASAVPSTLVSETTLRALFTREVRWARTIRAVRPAGYAGTVIAFPLLFGVLNVLFAPSLLAPSLLLFAALAVRVGLHLWAHRVLRVPGRPQPWLVPLREALSVAVWCAGVFGSWGWWRGRKMSVRTNG